MFYSLYDAGKIRIGREYFTQILHSTTLWPAQSYSESLSRLDLTLLKIRLFLRFYGARRSSPDHVPLIVAIFRTFGDLLKKKSHKSKLEAALRNGIKSAYDSIKARLRPAWLSSKKELQMFENWDTIYRELRRTKLADGLIQQLPVDTSKLHLSNYVPMLRADHKNARSFTVPSIHPDL
jgi:hypothetical protein